MTHYEFLTEGQRRRRRETRRRVLWLAIIWTVATLGFTLLGVYLGSIS